MIIRQIEDKEEWDRFVQKQPFYTFINSWDWGEFNKLMGAKIFRLGFYDDNVGAGQCPVLIGLALVIKVEARRGTHLFCPYGPMFEFEGGLTPSKGVRPLLEVYFNNFKEILPELIKLAKKEDACFLRIHPPVPFLRHSEGVHSTSLRINSAIKDPLVKRKRIGDSSPSFGRAQNDAVFRQPAYSQGGNIKEIGFRPAPIHVHAEDTWLLDLCHAKSEAICGRDAINRVSTTEEVSPLSDEELLSNMRKTTRYLIKRAIKEGVEVYKNNSEEYIDKFIEMHKSHSSRDKGAYTAFSDSYIKNLFKAFPDEDMNLMYAEYEKPHPYGDGAVPRLYNDKAQCTVATTNIEAMLVSIKYGKTTAYYLGASDIKHPKFSPAYLLQWEAIKKARDAGCEYYNFWGISPDDNPKHPLSGVSLFKKGFGGYDYKLMHAQDLPLTPKYWLNWAVESGRRMRRGYYYKLKV